MCSKTHSCLTIIFTPHNWRIILIGHWSIKWYGDGGGGIIGGGGGGDGPRSQEAAYCVAGHWWQYLCNTRTIPLQRTAQLSRSAMPQLLLLSPWLCSDHHLLRRGFFTPTGRLCTAFPGNMNNCNNCKHRQMSIFIVRSAGTDHAGATWVYQCTNFALKNMVTEENTFSLGMVLDKT